MSLDKTPPAKFVTVLRSESLLSSDRRAAIELVPRELGPIAFEVDRRAIKRRKCLNPVL